MSDLLTSQDEAIGTITLNRPDRLNAISGPMLEGLSAALVDFDRDPSVRVIVLTGAGRGFCSGLDLKDASSGQGIGGGTLGPPGEFDLRDAPPVVLHKIDTPSICALNGAAAGYGMDLALGCDMRIAAQSAKLVAAPTRRGVLPESGGTWILPRLVGWARASEIMFAGKTLLAEECLDLGLVNRVVPDELLIKETLALAQEVASAAPLAVRATKRMMRMGLTEGFEEHVQRVFVQLLPLFGSKDFAEGMKAFIERRKPEFTGS